MSNLEKTINDSFIQYAGPMIETGLPGPQVSDTMQSVEEGSQLHVSD